MQPRLQGQGYSWFLGAGHIAGIFIANKHDLTRNGLIYACDEVL